jgi:hypothetical protein
VMTMGLLHMIVELLHVIVGKARVLHVTMGVLQSGSTSHENMSTSRDSYRPIDTRGSTSRDSWRCINTRSFG